MAGAHLCDVAETSVALLPSLPLAGRLCQCPWYIQQVGVPKGSAALARQYACFQLNPPDSHVHSGWPCMSALAYVRGKDQRYSPLDNPPDYLELD